MRLCYVVCLLLVACGSPVAVAPTATPQPTIPTTTPTFEPTSTPTIVPTATPVPLADLDIEPLLVADGDLPSSFQPGQIEDLVINDDMPKPEQATVRLLDFADGPGGYVAVYLYANEDDRNEAFDRVVGSGGEDVSGIGERAKVNAPGANIPIATVSFIRCHAVVSVRLKVETKLNLPPDSRVAENYAKRLDKRLQPVVCNTSP